MIERQFSKNEDLNIKASIASENDWEDCKKFRIKEITDEDCSEMFGFITKEDIEDAEKSDKNYWKNKINSEDEFCTIIRANDKVVGFGNAINKGNGIWRIRWGYTDKEFRGQGIQKKNIALRLKEILKRGGKTVESGVLVKNLISMSNLSSFGFKISDKHFVGQTDQLYAYTTKLDLTNDEVIKAIDNFVI